MDNLALPGVAPVEKRRRGRPPGSKNRRAAQLAKLNDAVYGGTAAQQLAAFVMVTPLELAQAKGDMVRARVRKAVNLVEVWKEETGEKITPADAMMLLTAGLKELLPYTDQRQAPREAPKGEGKALPTVVVGDVGPISMDPGCQVVDFDPDADFFGDVQQIQGVSEALPALVSQAKSHDEGETLAPQGIEDV